MSTGQLKASQLDTTEEKDGASVMRDPLDQGRETRRGEMKQFHLFLLDFPSAESY